MKSRKSASRRSRAPESVAVPTLTLAQASALEIYDTTLRDGAQAEDVSFSVEDKLRVAQQLDELGVHFIEGGCGRLFRFLGRLVLAEVGSEWKRTAEVFFYANTSRMRRE